MNKQQVWFFAWAIAMLAGCEQRGAEADVPSPVLRLAVTTSTRDSGLLDLLVPIFEREHRVRVDVIAVGTGAALKLGEAGDVDVVLVHARQAEDAFMAAAHGIRREDVMYNTFELLGPPNDPAGIRNLDPIVALQKIASAQQPFVSRGDESGTHIREKQLWEAAGERPAWDDYVESGQGMGATLTIADELNAYVLTDRGTYLKFKPKIRLIPLAAAAPPLRNSYGILVVNPQTHPGVRADLADAFVDFMISPQSQQRIRNYTIAGEPLFYPLRLSIEN